MKKEKRAKQGMALVLTAALLVPNGAYAANVKDFSDFPTDWSASAMSQAVENGLLGGYDGKILPKGALTRAEMATIINRAFGATQKADLSGYTDVASDAWYYGDMAKAVKMGTFVGAGAGKLNPSQQITREEAFVVLARAFEVGTADAQSLAAYSDAAEVSEWARQAVAAMVAEGYVSGFDGKLSPKATITRAEFAAIMSKMVASYVTDATTINQDVDGNLVVRSAGVTLKDMTVKGDLILADGLGKGSATLDNVTVTGRVIIRGGGENSVKFNQSTVKEQVILNDRNSATRLVNISSLLGALMLYSDAILDGDFDNVSVAAPLDGTLANGKIKQIDVNKAAKGTTLHVEKGASTDSVQINADNVVIDGEGTVKDVNADANHIKVLTKGARVHAGAGTVGVMAGTTSVKPGNSGTVADKNNTGGSNGNGGSTGGGSNGNGGSTGGGSNGNGGSTGGGSNGNGGTENGGNQTEQAQGTLVKVEKAQIVQTDAGAWLPLVFVDGVTADDVRLVVDGDDVTASMSKVMTDGSVAKLPLVGNPGSVTVKSDKYTQTINLGDDANADAVYEGDNYLPDYFLAHGPVAVWDYHLTNYDNNGKARVLPSVTTFGSGQSGTTHPFYSPVAVLDEGNEAGTVEIMFNYTKDEDKAWFDGVADSGALTLVSYDQYKQDLNKQLKYEKTTADHYGNTVGVLKIPFGQSNFKSNGRYYVRVAVKGTDGQTTYQMIPIHVVNHDTPSLKVKETPESGRNLHFEVSNLLYGVVDPIESVVLTKPSGKTVTLNKIDDYFLISQDSFVLYNDVNATNGTNHFDEIGNYTLTIQAAGFQDFSCTFNVGGAAVATQQSKAARAASVDVISSATGGGSSSGGSSSEGGGLAIQANLLFDGDLLANALVLEKLGQETTEASAVLDYWKSNVIADAVFDTGDTSYYKWSDFISNINSAQTKNQLWVPFATYRQAAKASVNPPNATKAVLEDGLLGELQDVSVSGKLESPQVTVSNNKQGQDPVLTFSGKQTAEYLGKVKELRLNGDYRSLGSDLYTIDATKGTITLKSNCLTVGTNTLTVQAEGYKPQTVTIDYKRVTEEGLTLTADASANKVVLTVNGSEGDFLKSLQSVTLTKNGGKATVVYPQGVEGGDAEYYVVGKDYKTITLYNVKAGDYNVSVKAKDYTDALTAGFNVNGTAATLQAPDMTVNGQKNGYYQLTFTEKQDAADSVTIDNWANKIQAVTVNGQTYTKYEGMFGAPTASSSDYASKRSAYGENVLQLGGAAFNQDKNTVVIQSEGYEAFTVVVNKDGSVGDKATTEPETPAATTPTVSKVELVTGGLFDDYYNIAFTTTDKALNTYLKSIDSVSSNGQAVQKNSNFINSVKAYRTNTGDDYTGNLWYLQLSKSSIEASGQTTVEVNAPGYKALTLTFKDGQYTGSTVTAPEPGNGGNENGGNENQGTKLPKAKALSFESSLLSSTYRLSFETADAALATYLSKVTAITVDGQNLHAVSGFWNESLAYKMRNDDALGGDICFIDMSPDCIKSSGTSTIVIKAEGYPNMTLQVKDGALVR